MSCFIIFPYSLERKEAMMRSLAERKRMMRPVLAAAPMANTLAKRAKRVGTETRAFDGSLLVVECEANSSVTRSIIVPMLKGTDIVTAEETKRSPMPAPMSLTCGLARANNLKSVSLSLERLGFLAVVVVFVSVVVDMLGVLVLGVGVVESKALNGSRTCGRTMLELNGNTCLLLQQFNRREVPSSRRWSVAISSECLPACLDWEGKKGRAVAH
jgi:hypothetical protein